MRKLLLAVIAVAWMLPAAADAARRDERGRQGAAQPAQARVVKANPAAKAAPQAARPQAAPAARGAAQSRVAAPSRPAIIRGATARPAAGRAGRTLTTSREARSRNAMAVGRALPGARQAMHRPGEARTRNVGFLMRSAAAATVMREAPANCSRRNGRTVCAARDTDGVAGWQAGLPPVDYAQRACPAGTFATLARGHDDVVRCMPI